MARQYLRAVRYGVRNLRSVAAMVVSIVGLYLICVALLPLLFYIDDSMAATLFTVAVVGGLHVAIGGYFLRYWLDALLAGLEGLDDPPDRPPVEFVGLLGLGLRGLGLYVVYVLPVFTLPLLPLGILALAYTGDGRAYDLAWAARAAMRRPLQLAVLWLVLLLWTLAMLVGVWGALLLYAWLVAGHVGWFLALVLLLPAVGLAAMVVCAFATVIHRCIGIFGGENPVLIDMLPEKANRWRAAGFVLGGLAVSIGMQSAGIALMAAWPG